MKVIGVICEYNPFHNGHLRQLAQIKSRFGADTAIVCLMSGDFCQRGECAVFPKRVRAAAAVECGASLVLELPVPVSLSSAEGFAAGAVRILDRLGCVDALCFGSESGDTERIVNTAKLLCSEEYRQAFRTEIETGVSYAAARQAALEALGADGQLLSKPNDILAVEYCKALLTQNSAIEPVSVLRAGDYGSLQPDAENPSALSLRALLPDGDLRPFVPEAAAKLYETAPYHAMQFGEKAMLARLYAMEPEQWKTVPFSSEGLWSAVYKALQTESSVEGIIEAAKSKRYVRTRLTRLLACAFLGVAQEDMAQVAPYIRALAFDECGGSLLRKIRKNGTICVLNAGEKAKKSPYSELENRTARLYRLFSDENAPQDTVSAEKSRIYSKKT